MIRGLQKQLGTAICALLGLVFLLQAEAARGEPPASVAVAVERLSQGNQAIIRLTAIAGEKDAAFGFDYDLPAWPSPKKVYGDPVAISSVAMKGSGTLQEAKAPGDKPYGRNYTGKCMRPWAESRLFFAGYWVEIPAGSTATIELLAEATFPSWPGTSYDIGLYFFHANEVPAPRYHLQTVSVSGLSPVGTHIRVKAVRGGGGMGRKATPEIVGTTEPPLRSARIALRAVPAEKQGVHLDEWSGKSAVRLGAVRTDRQGRFRLPPQPFSAAGKFVFIARSEARGGRVADWNCGPVFTVGSR